MTASLNWLFFFQLVLDGVFRCRHVFTAVVNHMTYECMCGDIGGHAGDSRTDSSASVLGLFVRHGQSEPSAGRPLTRSSQSIESQPNIKSTRVTTYNASHRSSCVCRLNSTCIMLSDDYLERWSESPLFFDQWLIWHHSHNLCYGETVIRYWNSLSKPS